MRPILAYLTFIFFYFVLRIELQWKDPICHAVLSDGENGEYNMPDIPCAIHLFDENASVINWLSLFIESHEHINRKKIWFRFRRYYNVLSYWIYLCGSSHEGSRMGNNQEVVFLSFLLIWSDRYEYLPASKNINRKENQRVQESFVRQIIGANIFIFNQIMTVRKHPTKAELGNVWSMYV